MRLMRSLPLCVLASAVLCGTVAMAQQFAPTVRIVNRIDETQLVTLKGNTHPAANAKNDQGRVSPTLPMTDLILVLSRDPAQQAAFDKFVASQYDATSPNYHHWLTPDQVGANFGPSETDIATVSNWLTGHGFSISQVTKDHLSIRFSGTAAQVESTFHTEIHNLSVKGVAHIANMSDPQIPAALSPVVVGVKSLHNFFPRPLHRMGSVVTRDAETGKWMRNASPLAASKPGAAAASTSLGGGARANLRAAPRFGISVGGANPYLVEDVGPYDFATIYNILPLWKAGFDGTGQTIAIAGTSAINAGTSVANGNGNNDVATFRSFFGLPTNNPANTPILQSGNSQPLTACIDTTGVLPYPTAPCGEDDLIENTLDVEWSGSVAENAQIVLVSSYPASASDDNLYDSESYIVDNVGTASSPVYGVHIMNVSYGECELALGTAGNVQYYDLWQAASTEGIAVFAAAGDSGSASCDDGGDAEGNPYSAQYGLSVSGIASTPYDTAVGGTDFNWCPMTDTLCTASPYWSSTNQTPPGSSNASYTALGYVPEVPWNDTCTSSLALSWMESFWSGVATVTDAETGCNAFVNNIEGLYDSGDASLETIVDTVGGSGGASGCIVNSTSTSYTNTTLGSCTNGSTSTGATTGPDTGTAQGSITLVNNGWPKPSWQAGVTGIPSDGVRDIPDVSFFASDGFLSSSAYLICVSYISPCSYSSKTEPTAQEVGGTSVATPAMAGVMALINQKAGAAQGSPNTELYKLAASQTYSSCSAERGNGAPVTSSSCVFNDIDTGTNAMACDYGAPEGGVTYSGGEYVLSQQYEGVISPNCTPIHSGDTVAVLSGYSATAGFDLATGLGSLNVANVVNAWTPVIQTTPVSGSSLVAVTVTPAQSALNLSQTLGVTGAVASSPSGGATPTGTVTITAGTYSSSTSLSSTGTYSFTVPANSLGVGPDTINVAYSGDTIYSTGDGTAVVTVEGTGSTFTLAATTPAAIAPGASASSTVTATAVLGYTGTVTLTCAETSTTATGGDGASCSVPSGAVAMGGSATAMVTTTAASTAGLVYPNVHGNGKGWMGAGGGAVLAFLVFMGIPARRRSWRQMLGVLVLLMVALGGLAACGGGSSSSSGGTSDPGTTAGAYTFTVYATATPSVTPTVQTTFTVTVN